MTYLEEVDKLLSKVDDELLLAFNKISKEIGTVPLKFKNSPLITGVYEIKLNFGTHLEGFYCKVGGIGFEITIGGKLNYLIIKAYRIAHKKYRLIKSYDLTTSEKLAILKELYKKYGFILK